MPGFCPFPASRHSCLLSLFDKTSHTRGPARQCKFAQDYLLHSTVYITTDGHPSRVALLNLALDRSGSYPQASLMYVLITLSLDCRFPILPKT